MNDTRKFENSERAEGSERPAKESIPPPLAFVLLKCNREVSIKLIVLVDAVKSNFLLPVEYSCLD